MAAAGRPGRKGDAWEEEKVIDLKSDGESQSLQGNLELITVEVAGERGSIKITIKNQSVLSSLLKQTVLVQETQRTRTRRAENDGIE